MTMTVGQLEQALFNAFPAEHALDWDNIGLAVGDRNAVAGRVALALDMTAANVIAAAEAGCNVLVTHHPPFIAEGPSEFGPQAEEAAPGPGRLVYEAARRGVACINMHTNADRAPRLRKIYAELLGMQCVGSFEHLTDPARGVYGPGLGMLFEPQAPLALSALATRCADKFGGSPRVWGEPAKSIRRIALLNGSGLDAAAVATCAAHGIDCVITGEPRYHVCADAQPHLAVIDLGHDVSELPIVTMLAATVAASGVAPDHIEMINMNANWWMPTEGE